MHLWIRALCVAAMEGRLDICAYLVEDLRVGVNQPNDLGWIVSSLPVNFAPPVCMD